MTNTTRQNYVLAGLCRSCGGPRDSEAQNCSACTERIVAAHKARGNDTTRGRREAAGLCIECGGERDSEAKRCRACIAKQVEYNQAHSAEGTRQKRKAAGLCIDCGAAKDPAASRCPACQGENAEAKRVKTNSVDRISGLTCTNCDRPRDQDTKLCSVCAENAAQASKAWRARRKADNTHCMYCTEPRWFESKSCRYHFVEKITHNFGMPKKHIEAMAKKLEDSNFKCVYSGIPLVPGDNASIDHALAVATHPERISDPNNLVWCDRGINAMKAAFNIPDFAENCVKVAMHVSNVLAMHAAIVASPIIEPASVARVIARKAPRKSGGTRVPIMLLKEEAEKEGILPSTPPPATH